MSVFTTAEALPRIIEYFEKAADATPSAARMALNKVIAGTGRTRVKRGMEAQVAWPKGYLNDRRLTVGRRATNEDLAASLIARQRPTSLARFDPSRAPGKRGATVIVKPGRAQRMDGAFFIRLRRGDELTEENFNLGLAIRLKPGERVLGRRSNFNADSTLQLLYGPSPDQVMQDVALEESPEILEDVETEFLRNFARLTETL